MKHVLLAAAMLAALAACDTPPPTSASAQRAVEVSPARASYAAAARAHGTVIRDGEAAVETTTECASAEIRWHRTPGNYTCTTRCTSNADCSESARCRDIPNQPGLKLCDPEWQLVGDPGIE